MTAAALSSEKSSWMDVRAAATEELMRSGVKYVVSAIAPSLGHIEDALQAAANAAGFKERVVGPSFVRGGQAFCLELYPGGFREDSRQHVGAYLRYQGAQKCVELRFRVSVVNRLGGPEIAWRSAFMLLGARAAPGEPRLCR